MRTHPHESTATAKVNDRCIHLLESQRTLIQATVREEMEYTGPRLLLVGDHDTLLLSRELILAEIGYRVSSFSSLQALRLMRFDCDLVLICHSVRHATAAALKERIGLSNPQAKVVRMTWSKNNELPIFDSVVNPADGPRSLILHVAELLIPENTAS